MENSENSETEHLTGPVTGQIQETNKENDDDYKT